MTNRAGLVRRQLADWFLRRTPASGIRRVLPLSAAVASETGVVRSENQDRVAIARSVDKNGRAFAIAAIADGIGGMHQGARCASEALAALIASVQDRSQRGGTPEEWLEAGIIEANRLVHAQFQQAGGTTLVALLLTGDGGGCWASVGDSRLYKASNAELTQLSKDDTIAGQLGRRPDIGTEQSKLLQFIGIGEPLEVRVQGINAAPNELAILTTDGVHFLERPAGVLGLVVQHAPDSGTCVRRLVDLAGWAGGPDNASAIAIPFHVNFEMDGVDGINGVTGMRYLEVWDPFGEIRLVDVFPLEPVTQQAEKAAAGASTDGTRIQTPLAMGEAESDKTLPAEVPRKAVPPAKKATTGKATRKRKTRKTGVKVPQVQLEFSPKGD